MSIFDFFRRSHPAPVPTRAEPRIATPPKLGVRKFKAARPSRLVHGFGSILPQSPRAEIRHDIRGLVNHARHAAQNVDHIKSYEMMVRRHVVGPRGVALDMNAKNVDGSADSLGNEAVMAAWKRWGQKGTCTPCGKLSWWGVEKVAATMLAREGNFLLRQWTGRRFGAFGFQVQPISIDLLCLDLMRGMSNGTYIDGGVELDTFHKPVAFYFWDGHPAEAHSGRTGRRIRVPAEDIVHVFRATETGQDLGVPESHTAVRRFNMLAKYEESALTAAHFGAAAMTFLEQTDPDGAPASPDASGMAEELPTEVEAGAIVELPPGYEAKANPSSYPDANMPGFLKSMARGGAAGLGVSYAGLSSDMEGANFSSLKDGRGEERDEWRMFQRDLYEGLHMPVFAAWLPLALLTDQVRVAGRPIPASRLDKFLDAASWRPRGWPSVNPKDDAVANEKDLENGLVAPSDIVAARGDDFEDLVARRKRDMDTLKAADVPLPAVLTGTPKAKPAPPAEAAEGAPQP
ncbi:MAG: phage portal protein [Pseudomonadota bacterium]